jgi:tagatose 6-phosphate kinase
VIDATGPALRLAAQAGADVLKPNRAELRDSTGQDDVLAGARELRAAGARAVVVSLGQDGLLAVTGEGSWRARPPHPVRGNATGAGDAVVAALASGLADDVAWPERLRFAVALSMAAVAAPVAGSVLRQVLDQVRNQVTVELVQSA